MPNAAKRLCSIHRVIHDGTCPKCAATRKQRQREWNASKPTDPFLGSTAWQKLRAAYLHDHPCCERCESHGRTTPAAQVHHIEARQDNEGRSLDWDNLMAVCTRCHRALTVQAMRERKQRGDSPSG